MEWKTNLTWLTCSRFHVVHGPFITSVAIGSCNTNENTSWKMISCEINRGGRGTTTYRVRNQARLHTTFLKFILYPGLLLTIFFLSLTHLFFSWEFQTKLCPVECRVMWQTVKWKINEQKKEGIYKNLKCIIRTFA